jgi:hypothetical protein
MADMDERRFFAFKVYLIIFAAKVLQELLTICEYKSKYTFKGR